MDSQVTDSYKKMQVETADQKTLILMLYDKAISLLDKGREGVEAKDHEQKGHSLSKTKDIVFELLSSLDMERGGEVAAKLSVLYDYVIREIMEADSKLSVRALDNAKRIMSELREGWNGTNVDSNIESQDVGMPKVNVDICG